MSKWEHIQIDSMFDDQWYKPDSDDRWPNLITALNDLGQEGWECAAMTALQSPTFPMQTVRRSVVLKRPIPDPLPPTCRDCGALALITVQCVDGVRCYPCAMRRGTLVVEEKR